MRPSRPKPKGNGQPTRTRRSLANGRTVEGAWGQSRQAATSRTPPSDVNLFDLRRARRPATPARAWAFPGRTEGRRAAEGAFCLKLRKHETSNPTPPPCRLGLPRNAQRGTNTWPASHHNYITTTSQLHHNYIITTMNLPYITPTSQLHQPSRQNYASHLHQGTPPPSAVMVRPWEDLPWCP